MCSSDRRCSFQCLRRSRDPQSYPTKVAQRRSPQPRSEERREGKSVDLGGRRIIKKKKVNLRILVVKWLHNTT